MKVFILSAASILGVTDAQVYADTLTDYALNDLSAILAAYDVGDYSREDYSQYSEDYAINYDNYNGDNAYSTDKDYKTPILTIRINYKAHLHS